MTAKDLVLALITQVGTGGGVGHVVEYRGPAIEALSMEGRMTISNMSIEWGAKAGLIAPDETTFAYLKGRPYAPTGADWDAALDYWRTLRDRRRRDLRRRGAPSTRASVTPFVTWGTNPGQGVPLDGVVPDPAELRRRRRAAAARAGTGLHGPRARHPAARRAVDVVFVGSCTNGRLEDLRAAADVLRGREVADGVRMLVVPGSAAVRAAAEAEGLDKVFTDAGAEWRFAGCSMCLGMNPDTLAAGPALGLHVQPQLRGPAGPRRPYPPRLAAGRRRDRRRRPLRRPGRPELRPIEI